MVAKKEVSSLTWQGLLVSVEYEFKVKINNSKNWEPLIPYSFEPILDHITSAEGRTMTKTFLCACDCEVVRGIWISSDIIERTTKQLKKARHESHTNDHLYHTKQRYREPKVGSAKFHAFMHWRDGKVCPVLEIRAGTKFCFQTYAFPLIK